MNTDPTVNGRRFDFGITSQAHVALANTDPTLSIVVPVYRSADCLDSLVRRIDEVLTHEHDFNYELILVNDCSPDNSWNTIQELSQAGFPLVGINLRRNFGQDCAILTGMRYVRGQFVAVMDDDLQHDPSDLPRLIEAMHPLVDVVYANFEHKEQALWKNLGSWLNGKFAEYVIGKPKHIYLSPYKLIRADVVREMTRYDGPTPYIDGLLFLLTSRITQIAAKHHPRHAGQSNFTLTKSIQVALRLILSFSPMPLRLVGLVGIICSLVGSFLAVFVVAHRLLFPESFPVEATGWASLMIAILIVGGIQLGCLGVVGEYVGRIFARMNLAPQTSIAEVTSVRSPIPERVSHCDSSRPTR